MELRKAYHLIINLSSQILDNTFFSIIGKRTRQHRLSICNYTNYKPIYSIGCILYYRSSNIIRPASSIEVYTAMPCIRTAESTNPKYRYHRLSYLLKWNSSAWNVYNRYLKYTTTLYERMVQYSEVKSKENVTCTCVRMYIPIDRIIQHIVN